VPTTKARRRADIRPRVKVWIEVGEEHAFCAGMCRILQAVDQTGSIKSAAAEIGRSYRFVWGRLKEVEDACGITLVDAQVGGARQRRSSLTPTGRALVESFVRLQSEMHKASDACAAEVRQALHQPNR
jgi:molybdate transport repressor ModE-like protein